MSWVLIVFFIGANPYAYSEPFDNLKDCENVQRLVVAVPDMVAICAPKQKGLHFIGRRP